MRVVAKRGFHGASVDSIADAAGLSIGALYANFDSKDDVLFAVFDEHLRWFEKSLQAAASAPDTSVGIAGWLAALGEEPEQFLVFVEFWCYAVRKPALRKQLRKQLSAMQTSVSEVVAGRGGPLPPALAAQLAMAIGRGLAFEKLTDPKVVDDAAVAQLVAGIVGGTEAAS